MSYLLLFIVIQYVISDGNFYCYRRIFEDSSNITAIEINELCSLISKDDRFILRFPLSSSILPSTSETIRKNFLPSASQSTANSAI